MQLQLPDFTQSSILLVGDVMLDRYWFGRTTRISPEAPVPIVNVAHTDERPGGAANVALNIAKLGATVRLLGTVGTDQAADVLKQKLTEAAVLHDFQKTDACPTIVKLRIVSHHQQLLRLDFEEKMPHPDGQVLIESFKKHLKSANLVIFSDYNKGSLAHVAQLIPLAKKAGVTVLVDPKGTDFTPYQGADIITPNLKEFEAIVGSCANESDILKKALQFLNAFDISAILLTQGERGMTLIQQNGDKFHLPAHAREVYDVTGAGDTVIATLGAALGAKTPVLEAMALANLAASLVVAKLGTASISQSELNAALQQRNPPTKGMTSEEDLLHAITSARFKGKKIVFTNGCFDILHAGHVTYLEQAKQLGDFLIVAINDDASVKRLKGTSRPLNSTAQRMAVLASLGVVDCVTFFPEDTPERLLKLLQPDILVKGGDYQLDGVVGADIVHSYGGEVRVLGVIEDISTSAIINRIINNNE